MASLISQLQTITGMPGDWQQTVAFNQFDPAGGDLLDAIFTTEGTLDVSASFENLSPAAATVLLGVTATIVATAPEIGNVASVTPMADALVNLGGLQGPFDGILNFGGPSGTVLPDLTASQTVTDIVATGPSGTLPLVGTGVFGVTVSSYATSTVDGNANLGVLLHSSSGVVLSLQYQDEVSPPGGNIDAGDYYGATDYLASTWWGAFQNYVTTTPQVVTLASQTSGWTGTASFAQFNPALGTLDEIIVNVGNTVAGTFAAENLEPVAASVNMTETASLTVGAPGGSSTATASTGDILKLGAFDGTADFAGVSGQSELIDGDLANAAVTNGSVTSTDTAPFIGTGTIALPVSTAGTSIMTGPSNLLSEITQSTGGTVSISYVYTSVWSPVETFPSYIYDDLIDISVGATAAPFAHPQTPQMPATATVGAALANTPRMTFIGGVMGGNNVIAQPNETFSIDAGTTSTIREFCLTDGDKLDLTALLSGAPLARDFSNLGAFVQFTDSTLSINGPGGKASVVLTSGQPMTLADLLNDKVLVLASH